MAHVFNDDNFQKEVLDAAGVVLVDFWAPWCHACQVMSPVIDELAEIMAAEGVVVGKMNVDASPTTANQFNIMSIPRMIVFKGGKPVAQATSTQTIEQLQGLIRGA